MQMVVYMCVLIYKYYVDALSSYLDVNRYFYQQLLGTLVSLLKRWENVAR